MHPVMHVPDFMKHFWVQMDASNIAIGAVSSQQEEGKKNPMAYISHKLHLHEQAYTTVEKEYLAVK